MLFKAISGQFKCNLCLRTLPLIQTMEFPDQSAHGCIFRDPNSLCLGEMHYLFIDERLVMLLKHLIGRVELNCEVKI